MRFVFYWCGHDESDNIDYNTRPMSEVELLFLGTGTSAGIPMIGCECDTCQSTDLRDKRTRPSVVISYHGKTVLVDTTPELRLQALAQQLKHIDAVVYTHAHADHIMGLDDLRRFNAIKEGPLDIWADQQTYQTLMQCFGYAFKKPAADSKVFRPHLIHCLIEKEFEVEGLKWIPIPMMHGEMPVLGFRVGNLAYCTDVSKIPESSYALLQGLDVLILDALQWKKHTTHLTIEEAIAVTRRVKPKRTYFTHIAHALKHEPTNAVLPNGIELAYDGLRIKATIE